MPGRFFRSMHPRDPLQATFMVGVDEAVRATAPSLRSRASHPLRHSTDLPPTPHSTTKGPTPRNLSTTPTTSTTDTQNATLLSNAIRSHPTIQPTFSLPGPPTVVRTTHPKDVADPDIKPLWRTVSTSLIFSIF
ncbi:hypothetical protein AcW1_002619 [Taiwanofungus camphoratus]|nr:hypothetical protein AcV5_009700 [Antrodia cinnamomea]KAI0942845.1 hypothetical protein AcV7_002143 [Antrodia cinnamomea]KAI0943464.1 hypothetical protein AcW1_002619 [Antrodia cinnamomea]